MASLRSCLAQYGKLRLVRFLTKSRLRQNWLNYFHILKFAIVHFRLQFEEIS